MLSSGTHLLRLCMRQRVWRAEGLLRLDGISEPASSWESTYSTRTLEPLVLAEVLGSCYGLQMATI